MSAQQTAKAMLERNGFEYDAHGSGYGVYIHITGRGWVYHNPSAAINFVIDSIESDIDIETDQETTS